MLVPAVILMLAVVPLVGSAQMTFFLGHQLMEDCEKPGNVSVGAYNSCVMYLAGVHDAALQMKPDLNRRRPPVQRLPTHAELATAQSETERWVAPGTNERDCLLRHSRTDFGKCTSSTHAGGTEI